MDSHAYLEKEHDGFYYLNCPNLLNQYYVISDPATSKLMASPEVTGYDAYLSMVPPTVKALNILKQKDNGGLGRVNILSILRGALNYPVESACHDCGILVSNISFMSCERVIVDNEITGLDVKYEKIHTEDDCTLLIGDIIASGATLKLCLEHVVDRFRQHGHKIRKIIFFTIGGTKAIDIMEDMTQKIRKVWPSFEGFQCVFYEGIFTVYSDNGVTGVNVPDIDFGWKGGAIAPEFRQCLIDYDYAPALLEKCIIYDGGARRYEIGLHAEEVADYWKSLLAVADKTDFQAFVEEKAGYAISANHDEWLKAAHLPVTGDYATLHIRERVYLAKLLNQNLREICEKRLAQLKGDFKEFNDIL